jgi:single-strand DNA-binding protein
MYETHLTVVGTVITAVKRRRLPDGTSVASFRIASNERRYNRAADDWTDGDSLYLSVSCWRQLAENVHTTFDIGDPIIVRGRLHTRSYEDKDGRPQTVVEMEGLAVGPDLTRATARIVRLRRDGSPVAAMPRSTDGAGDPDAVAPSDDPWLSPESRTVDGAAGGSGQLDQDAAVEVGVG